MTDDNKVSAFPRPVEREITAIPKGMRPGKRVLNSAQLTVAMSNAVPPEMRPGVRELIGFTVAADDRRKRLGTMLMNMVCQEADANRITLLLTAAPPPEYIGVEGQMDEAQLVGFYLRFGFTMLQQTPTGTLMARRVHMRAPAPRINLEVGNAVKLAIQRAQQH